MAAASSGHAPVVLLFVTAAATAAASVWPEAARMGLMSSLQQTTLLLSASVHSTLSDSNHEREHHETHSEAQPSTCMHAHDSAACCQSRRRCVGRAQFSSLAVGGGRPLHRHHSSLTLGNTVQAGICAPRGQKRACASKARHAAAQCTVSGARGHRARRRHRPHTACCCATVPVAPPPPGRLMALLGCASRLLAHMPCTVSKGCLPSIRYRPRCCFMVWIWRACNRA